MYDVFVIKTSAATIIGKDHLATGKNNQDAYHVIEQEGAVIGVVCDGCSTGGHSEVGANLAARIVGETISRNLWQYREPTPDFTPYVLMNGTVKATLIQFIKNTVGLVGHINDDGRISKTKPVSDFFLFTIVGFCISENLNFVFSIGDGVVAIDDEITELKPEANNEPVYVAYDLVNTTLESISTDFQILDCTGAKTLLVGTDGLKDLIAAENRKVPGKEEEVGPLSQFWQPQMFSNPDSIRRRLFLLNRTVQKLEKGVKVGVEYGHLPDDTTLIAMRRDDDEQ